MFGSGGMPFSFRKACFLQLCLEKQHYAAERHFTKKRGKKRMSVIWPARLLNIQQLLYSMLLLIECQCSALYIFYTSWSSLEPHVKLIPGMHFRGSVLRMLGWKCLGTLHRITELFKLGSFWLFLLGANYGSFVEKTTENLAVVLRDIINKMVHAWRPGHSRFESCVKPSGRKSRN